MLRFWITVSLLLMVVFTGIGLATSKVWGWSEYASPELYLVYTEVSQSFSYFLLDINDGDIWKLLKDETLSVLRCSPDGRTLAYMSDRHLYVVNQQGIIYDEVLDEGYYLRSLANNGEVAIAKSNRGNIIDVNIISPEGRYLVVQPDNLPHDLIEINSSGNPLWTDTSHYGIQWATSGGETLMSVIRGRVSNWFASEDIFTFFYNDSALNGYIGIADTAHHIIRNFRSAGTIYYTFSPDATKQAFTIVVDGRPKIEQIYLVDLLAGQSQRQLTFDAEGDHAPLCFLSFRPQMLIVEP